MPIGIFFALRSHVFAYNSTRFWRKTTKFHTLTRDSKLLILRNARSCPVVPGLAQSSGRVPTLLLTHRSTGCQEHAGANSLKLANDSPTYPNATPLRGEGVGTAPDNILKALTPRMYRVFRCFDAFFANKTMVSQSEDEKRSQPTPLSALDN